MNSRRDEIKEIASMRLLASVLTLSIVMLFGASTVQAEESLLLSDVLKPSAEASGQTTTPNITLVFFYTLLVLGLGILVIRQPWFLAWLDRVKLAHLQEEKPILHAMWQSILPSALPTDTGRDLNTAEAFHPLDRSVMPSWLERVDRQELASGVKLHWVRLHGQDYLLTETANHTQWMKLGDNENRLPDEDTLTQEAEPLVQRLPDYLDTI
jgi:hypothetical protein